MFETGACYGSSEASGTENPNRATRLKRLIEVNARNHELPSVEEGAYCELLMFYWPAKANLNKQFVKVLKFFTFDSAASGIDSFIKFIH